MKYGLQKCAEQNATRLDSVLSDNSPFSERLLLSKAFLMAKLNAHNPWFILTKPAF
jgi:hypothetical protein